MQVTARFKSSLAVLVFVAGGAWCGHASANGRFPQAGQIAFHPADPAVIIARTTFGLVVSRDAGASWRWVCESAIGLGGTQQDPYFGVTQGGSILGALWEGMSVSPDLGCNWSFVSPLVDETMIDLVVRADDPRSALAVTGTYNPDAGAGIGGTYHTQVFASADDGATWTARGVPIDPTARVTTIEAAKSDPHRIYASTRRGNGATATADLWVSLDDGATWAQRPVPLVAGEAAVYIGAVDPLNADLVYLRTDARSRLLVTSDAGKTFTPASFVSDDGGTSPSLSGYMFGFAISPDGSKIYAGGSPNDGLYVGARGSGTLAHRSSIHVVCLTTHGDELWACSDEASGFALGASTDDGATFTAKLHLSGLDGVAQCAAGSQIDQCRAQYAPLCQRLGGCLDLPADGGALDASGPAPGDDAGADAGSAASSGGGSRGGGSSSGGCSAAGSSGPAWIAALLAVVLVAARRRKTQARRGSNDS